MERRLHRSKPRLGFVLTFFALKEKWNSRWTLLRCKIRILLVEYLSVFDCYSYEVFLFSALFEMLQKRLKYWSTTAEWLRHRTLYFLAFIKRWNYKWTLFKSDNLIPVDRCSSQYSITASTKSLCFLHSSSLVLGLIFF